MKNKSIWSAIILLLLGGCGAVALFIVGAIAVNYFTTIPEDCGMEEDFVRYGPIRVGTEVLLGRHRPVNETGEWVIVMSKWSDKDKTTQSYTLSSEFPEEYIREKIDDGYYIYLIDHANGNWIVAMNKTNGFSGEQIWQTSQDFPDSDFIEEGWGDGFDITDVEYGNGLWVIVMSDWQDYSRQSYHYDSDFSDTPIASEELKKYFVTDLEYGMGRWVTLASKGRDYQAQSWTSSPEFPHDFIGKQRSEGYFVFDIEKKEGLWVVFMTRGDGQQDQVWFTSSTFPKAKIKGLWEDNYYLTNVSYGQIGQDLWSYQKNNYVGLEATVTELAGVDGEGCPTVRVNVDSQRWLWRVRDLEVASGNSTPMIRPAEFAENSGEAQPGRDTSISLADGAQITVPGSSIEKTITVQIERNPSKINSLPPLGDDVVALSDFYNYEVSGGSLIGPVEITIPFDPQLIPNQSGLLTIGIPRGDGWEFTPVTSYEGLVTYQTSDLGDPLIAWHFVDMERVNLEYEAGEKNYCKRLIPLNVSPAEGGWDTTYHLTGQLEPNNELAVDVSNLAIVVKANYWEDPAGGTFYTTTDEEGYFDIEIDPLTDEFFTFQEGLNGFHVLAECDSPKGSFSNTSEGWTTFKIEGDPPPASAADSPSGSSSGSSSNDQPVLYLDKDYFCRSGPSQSYPDVTSFYAGTSLPIIGRTDGGWWLVAINQSHTTKTSCWIGGGIAAGNTGGVTYYQPPPTQANGSVSIYGPQPNYGTFYGYASCQQASYADACDDKTCRAWISYGGGPQDGDYFNFKLEDYRVQCTPGWPFPPGQ